LRGCYLVVDSDVRSAGAFRGLLPLGSTLAISFGGTATVLVSAPVLLHVILAGEGFVALRAEGVLFARVLFRMTGGVTGSGEVVTAAVLLGQRARVGIFLCLLLCWTL
jgi:hypothetical protein